MHILHERLPCPVDDSIEETMEQVSDPLDDDNQNLPQVLRLPSKLNL